MEIPLINNVSYAQLHYQIVSNAVILAFVFSVQIIIFLKKINVYIIKKIVLQNYMIILSKHAFINVPLVIMRIILNMNALVVKVNLM